MGLYVYAICRDLGDPVPLPQGIAHPVDWIAAAGLAALVETDVDWAALQAQEDTLMQAVLSHDRLICALFAQQTVLPLRFGTVVVDEAALRSHLLTQATAYLSKLQTLDNKAEYLIQLSPVAYTSDTVTAELKGRDYFLAKKQLLQTQSDQQAQQSAQLTALQSTLTQFLPLQWEEENSHKLYCLADARQYTLLTTALQQWQTDDNLWQVSLSAAQPPYHFV
jgi:Gas vesicle synthesis protein GvpL/GvpF